MKSTNEICSNFCVIFTERHLKTYTFCIYCKYVSLIFKKFIESFIFFFSQKNLHQYWVVTFPQMINILLQGQGTRKLRYMKSSFNWRIKQWNDSSDRLFREKKIFRLERFLLNIDGVIQFWSEWIYKSVIVITDRWYKFILMLWRVIMLMQLALHY